MAAGTSTFGSVILRLPYTGVKACALCWTLTVGFVAERLVSSPSVSGGEEVSSMFLNLQNGCCLFGLG